MWNKKGKTSQFNTCCLHYPQCSVRSCCCFAVFFFYVPADWKSSGFTVQIEKTETVVCRILTRQKLYQLCVNEVWQHIWEDDCYHRHFLSSGSPRSFYSPSSLSLSFCLSVSPPPADSKALLSVSERRPSRRRSRDLSQCGSEPGEPAFWNKNDTLDSDWK